MVKASDNAFPSLLITEGTEPSAPAAGKQKLYIDSTTHLLKATNSSGTDRTIEGIAAGAITSSGLTQATARLLGRTTASTGAIEEITVGSGLSLAAGSLTATGGAGDAILGQSGVGGGRISGLQGSADLVPGSPNADDREFDSSTLGGAAVGSPTTIDANTTRKSHLYVKRASTTTSVTGRAWTHTFSNGDTITACQRWFYGGASSRSGLMLTPATPGACDIIGLGCSTNFGFYHDAFSNLTTYASTPGSFLQSTNQQQQQIVYSRPVYFRFVYNTSTSIDSQWSPDGFVWFTLVSGRNPGYTAGAFGLVVEPEVADTYAMWDWVRVNWTP